MCIFFQAILFETRVQDANKTTLNTHINTQMKAVRSESVVRKMKRCSPMAVVKRTALPCRTHYNGPSLKGARMGPVQILSDMGKGKQV